MKPRFEERMRALMPDKDDFGKFSEIIHTEPKNFVRCNTLKISAEDLFKRLKEKWDVEQPFPKYPEIILIRSALGPGELGNSIEHLLGYYYVQEISSMMSVIALEPQPGDFVLDLFASPGSKTTQIAAKMENSGTIIANDLSIDRISILVSNLEKAGVMNHIVTRKDAIAFCAGLQKSEFKFDRILLDAPCSGEGTLRSSPKTFEIWNEKVVGKLSRQQKKFFAYAIKLLKVGGTLVYSTCTHAPEENEAIVSFALENFPVKIETISLPIKCREGVSEWDGEKFDERVKNVCRIYPQDNDSEGFFVSKFTLLEEVKDEELKRPNQAREFDRIREEFE
jgi:NOL1/NOP2/sun family putative RNA methylase